MLAEFRQHFFTLGSLFDDHLNVASANKRAPPRLQTRVVSLSLVGAAERRSLHVRGDGNVANSAAAAPFFSFFLKAETVSGGFIVQTASELRASGWLPPRGSS